MSFSQFAGTAVVPTLSRIVLALAFMTTGYNKLFTKSTFDAIDAKALQELGVQVEPIGVASARPLVVPAAFVQEEKGAEDVPPAKPPPAQPPRPSPPRARTPPAETPPVEAPAAKTPPPAEPGAGKTPVIPAETEKPAAAPTAGGAQFQAGSLHQITLMCQRQGWPSPTSLAWAAALTELIGGGLLLLGFLSRLWGLGLAITMGVAFYLVSMGVYGVHTLWPWEYAREIPRFNTTFNQLGLFVLALGVLLTGPGPLSVDRILFRRAKTDRGILKPDDGPSLPSGRPV